MALKVLPFAAALDSRQLARFKNEAQAAALLQHQSIVPVYAVGCDRGVHYFAMQYIDGVTVSALIEELRQSETPNAAQSSDLAVAKTQPGRPPKGETIPRAALAPSTERSARTRDYARSVATLGAQAAEALEHAHERGVVHRDVKPSNLMVDERGQLWVADFGLAQVQTAGKLTMTGDLLGTLRYMSPEQALAQRIPVDHRTDVYSLGATFYEMLTLRHVFPGQDRQTLLRQIAFDEPVAPRKVNPAVPAVLEIIVLKALAKNPADRYATAREMADDLGRYLRDEPIRARRPTLPQRARSWSRRHRPAVAALAAGLVVALVGAIGAAFWYVDDRARQTAAQAIRGERTANRRVVAEREVSAALREADAARDDVRSRLSDPRHSAALINDPTGWEGRLNLGRAILRRAETIAANTEPALDAEWLTRLEGLSARLNQDEQDRQFVLRLERIRLDTVTQIDDRSAGPRFAQTFREQSWIFETGEVVELASRLRDSALRLPLVAALDSWAAVTTDDSLRGRLLAVARLADPGAWSDRLRDPETWRSPPSLERLAREATESEASPRLLSLLAALLYHAKRDPVPLLRGAAVRHAGDFWLHFSLGAFARDAKEREGFCRAALAMRPGSSAVLVNLGGALAEQGRREEGLDCYRLAIERDPTHARPHTNLGAALWRDGRFDEALRHLRRAIELDPKSATAHRNLGVVLGQQGKTKDAVASFQEALLLKPDDAALHYALGNLLAKTGQRDEAIASYRAATRYDPKHVQAHTNLGALLVLGGQREKGMECYREALRLNPKHGHTHYLLGVEMQADGKAAEAIDHYRQAIANSTRHSQANNNLGVLLWGRNQRAEAIACFKKAIEDDPKNPQPHNSLGMAHLRQGEPEKAIECFKKALELDPKFAHARNNLADAERALAARKKKDEGK